MAAFIAIFHGTGPTACAREVFLSGLNVRAVQMKYEHGHLLLLHRAGVRGGGGPADVSVAVLNLSGLPVFSRNPGYDIPETVLFNITDMTLTNDSLLILNTYVSKSALPGPGARSVLMNYQIATGELERVVETKPIACHEIVADEHKNIWCLGTHVTKFNDRQDYELVYKFSSNGELLGSYLPRSLFPHENFRAPNGKEPFSIGRNGSPKLFATIDGKLCLWLPNRHTLVELDSEGNVLAQTSLPGPNLDEGEQEAWRYNSVAVLPDGTLAALLPLPGGKRDLDIPSGLFRLDRAASSWELVGTEWAEPYPMVSLVGADEEGLVLWHRADARVLWLPLPR
jgi:hypothetical protein